MSLSPLAITGAATILAARRKSGQQGSRLPAWCRPVDAESALAVQAAVTARLGEAIGAWKCGMPGDAGVVAAPIYTGTIGAASPCAASAHAGGVRIEPELAFVLGRDLPAREAPYTAAEVDAAICRTHLALELIHSRYSDPADATFTEHLADGLLNGGLFIGPEIDGRQARLAATLPIRISTGAGYDVSLEGRHPNADPHAPLHWLAEFLRGRGDGLRAGQAVITGSYAGSIDVPAGQLLGIRYGSLGGMTVLFAPA